jgi:hypothetical protein
MHVPSNQRGRLWRRRHGQIALALAALCAGLAGVAQAVDFDENLKAPMVRNGTELKPKLARYVASMETLKTPLEQVRDKASLRERFDTHWLLGRLVDEHAPLPELAELGFEARGDGSYSIDTQKHPEWRPLGRDLSTISNAAAVDALAPGLIARGFREDDLAALRKYAGEHNLDQLRAERKLAIVLSAATAAKKLQKIRRPFDDQAMLAYFYQKSLGAEEVEQQWAEGLLNSLTPQAQRILASFYAEQPGSWFIAPTPTKDALEYERQLLLRPDLEKLARKAFEEGQL